MAESLEQLVKGQVVHPARKSDHSQVKLEIQCNFHQRGRGFWKFNTQLLRDKQYIEKMNKLIEIELEQTQNYQSKIKHWEIIKLAIRSSTIQYSVNKKRSQRNVIQVLEKKLSFWEREREEAGLFVEKQEQHITKLRQEIDSINRDRTQGAIWRCKARWEDMGEKPTKYFLNLEKANYNKKTILKLRDREGKEILNEKQILQEMTAFYKKLYTSKKKRTEDHAHYLNKLQVPVLEEDEKEELDRKIGLLELGKAVKELKNAKTPGINGIPVDFYKIFWGKLKFFMLDMFQEILETGKIHLSARRGVITLLKKIGKDPLMIENWRPITLLCADFKILDKVLARRLQSTLIKLINESQTGFQRGKQLGENMMKLLAIVDYCETERSSSVIISVDFCKAFDSIEWSAIDKALAKFNFGEGIREFIKTINRDIWCTVMNNNKWQDWFKIEKGCRQGSPSSAIIYILTAEILGLKIRSNKKIRGVKIHGQETKGCQFADDLWASLCPEKESIDQFMDELEQFHQFSGLEVNYQKSVAFKLGPCRLETFQFITKKTLAWVNEPVKILGFWISHDFHKMYEMNLEVLLEKVKGIYYKLGEQGGYHIWEKFVLLMHW